MAQLKKTLPLLLAGGIAFFAGAAAGMPASFTEIDDGDGVLTLEELQSFFGNKRGQMALDRYDANANGELSLQEVG